MSSGKIVLADAAGALRRSFSAVLGSRGYEVHEASDGYGAVALVNRHRPDAVILDVDLPEMGGVEICRRLKEDPETAGIPLLMTAERADRETVRRAAGAGAADFLVKTGVPITKLVERVRLLIEGRCDLRTAEARSRKPDVRSPQPPRPAPEPPAPRGNGGGDAAPAGIGRDAAHVARAAERLADAKALPFIARELVAMTADRGSTVKDLVEVIERDPAVTAKLLKLANSSLYGRQRQGACSARQAVSQLGMNGVREMVLGMSLVELAPPGDGTRLDRIALWKHSMAVSQLAGMMVGDEDAELAERVTVAGLLHDIGRAAADDLNPEAYAAALRRVREKGERLASAEAAELGADHCAMGERLAARWRLPDEIIGAIGHHHDGWAAISALAPKFAPRTAGIVKLADVLVRAAGWGHSGEESIEPLPADVLGKLGLGAKRVKAALSSLGERIGDLEQILSLHELPRAEAPRPDAGGAHCLLVAAAAELDTIEVLLRSLGYDVTRSATVAEGGADEPPNVIVFEGRSKAALAEKAAGMYAGGELQPRLVAILGASEEPGEGAERALILRSPAAQRSDVVAALGLGAGA